MTRQQQTANSKTAWPLWTAALTLALSASIGSSQSAQAADITVDGTNCTLAEAITSANDDNAAGNGCVDGSGADTITLQTDVSLTAQLPGVTSNITIAGDGHTVNGNNNAAVSSVFWNYHGDLTINDTTVSGGNTSLRGGGVCNYYGTLVLNGSTITGNASEEPGGGIYNYQGDVTVNESTVSNNSSEDRGGGIACYDGGNVTVIGSTVSGNLADGGGGIYNYECSLTVTSSTVSGNTATSRAGGIYNRADGNSATVVLTNSTVSGNAAELGVGGINNAASGTTGVAAATLNNTTVTGNSTNGIGGGVYNYAGYGSATIDLNNSLVSGNTAESGAEVQNYSYYGGSATVTADNHNLFAHSGETDAEAFNGFAPGATDINASSDGASAALPAILNPALVDNGGNTMTHALVADSPALDLDLNGTLAVDQRGVARPVGSGWDAGSFELEDNPCGAGRNLPANTWLMTAPPCAPEPAGIVAQLGDDLPGVYGTNWISFTWDPDVQDYGNPQAADDTLVPGKGNWHFSTSGGMMRLAGNYTSVTTCPADMSPALECFAIPLTVNGDGTSRWNLVGNPFPDSVAWAGVRVSVGSTFYTPTAAETAGIMSKNYYSWNGNVYETFDDATSGMIGTIPAQNSVWVRTLPTTGVDGIMLWIPRPSG
jgi:predicted outer membrane repeat protein